MSESRSVLNGPVWTTVLEAGAGLKFQTSQKRPDRPDQAAWISAALQQSLMPRPFVAEHMTTVLHVSHNDQ